MLCWPQQKSSRLHLPLRHTPWFPPPCSPSLGSLPLQWSPIVKPILWYTPLIGPCEYTSLIGPLLWLTSSLLSLAMNSNKSKDLHSFQSFSQSVGNDQISLLGPSLREDRVQTLELLHRPTPMLGNPDLTHKAKEDQHAP